MKALLEDIKKATLRKKVRLAKYKKCWHRGHTGMESIRLRLYGSNSSNQFPEAANGFQIHHMILDILIK